MDFIVTLLMMVALWLMYSLQQSYKDLTNKIQSISDKCIGQNKESSTHDSVDPVAKMKNNLLAGLSMLASSA